MILHTVTQELLNTQCDISEFDWIFEFLEGIALCNNPDLSLQQIKTLHYDNTARMMGSYPTEDGFVITLNEMVKIAFAKGVS